MASGEKVTTTKRAGEEQLELADTFIAHDKELASERCGPGQDGSDEGVNNQTQGMENSGVSTMEKDRLIELQEKDSILSHIQEQVVSEPEAGCNQLHEVWSIDEMMETIGCQRWGDVESCTPDT